MKNAMMKLTLTAAALVVAVGSASAQTILKAEIPFTFHSGAAAMPPGTYSLTVSQTPAGTNILQVRNLDTQRSILVQVSSSADASKAWQADGSPKMAFQCAGKRCDLDRLWVGAGAAYTFYMPKPVHDDSAHAAVIRLVHTKAD